MTQTLRCRVLSEVTRQVPMIWAVEFHWKNLTKGKTGPFTLRQLSTPPTRLSPKSAQTQEKHIKTPL